MSGGRRWDITSWRYPGVVISDLYAEVSLSAVMRFPCYCPKHFSALTSPKGVGWRWQKWISAIFLGVNFFLVFFFVPETRFNRGLDPNIAAPGTSQDLKSIENVQTQRFEDGSSEESSNERKRSSRTYLQSLNPWSGIDPDSSYIRLFLRPFPLILYPACIFATLACKSPGRITIFFSKS